MNTPTSHELDSIGKIEDAGNLVKGGGIDRYWQREGLSLDFKKLFNDTISDPWLFDSDLALAHFNLRSIEFGNWMSQKDRANFLYSSALSLQHLSLLYDIKPNQIGMNAKLSLALGARGSGGALAHYEPLNRSVINLTKTKGIGSLAHEFAHAIDNLISFHTGEKKQTYVSGGRATRKGYDEEIGKNGNYFEKQFEEFFNVLYYTKKGEPTAFNKTISKGTDYLNRRNEVFARTFEVYTHYKLEEQGIKNQFLVKPLYQSKVYPPIELVLQASKFIDNIIKRGFNLMKRSKGLSGTTLFTGHNGFRKTLKKSASLQDTLDNMQRIAYRDKSQVTPLALSLKGNSVAQSSENIWNYLRYNTRYKLDTDGIEELRTPSRSLIDGKKGITDENFGIDCDDYSILISALLQNLKIRHEWRVTAYKTKGKFQHIYPVAFDENGNAYVLDVVPEIPHFNYEAQPIIDLKIVPMELHELSGIEEEESSSVALEQQQDLLEELNEPFSLSGIDDENDLDNEIFENSFLSGFGEVATEEEAEIVLNGTGDILNLLERGLLAEVYKAKNALLKELKQPTILSQTIDVRKELSLLTTLTKVWNDEPMRDAAIRNGVIASIGYKNFYKALQASLEQFNDESLQGIDDEELETPIYLAKVDMHNIAFDDLLNDPNPDLQGLGDLGRRRRRGFFRKVFRGIKKAGKKVGKFAKKAIKAVVKFNPLSIAIRASIRLVLRVNLFKIASRLIYGFLSEAQAKQKGLDLNEWKKLVRAKNRAEKFYVKKMGGKASKFKRAITRGRAAKKTGLRLSGIDGIGAAVTAASGTAAASPFIIFIKKILSKINPKKLFSKIAQKIKNRRSSNASENSSSVMPSVYDTSNTFNNDSMNNPSLVPKQGLKAKVMSFIQKHKKKLVSVGIVGVVAIVGVVFWQKKAKKSKRSLAGIKAAKTRARNRKRSLAGAPRVSRTPQRRTTQRRLPQRRKPKALAAPVSGVATRKRSNTSRLKAMHKKAKQLQKKHPRSKYSSLLKKAATMI